MCFNLEVSTSTFIFSWGTALYLLQYKKLSKIQYQSIIFLMIFSLIQAADAILWYNDMKKNTTNFVITSYIIPSILAAQIIYNLFFRVPGSPFIIKMIGVVTCVYLYFRFHGYSNSVCDNYFSSPIWGSKELTYGELCLFMLLFTYPNYYLSISGAFVGIPLIQFLFNGGYGSMFCAVANLWAVWYLYSY